MTDAAANHKLIDRWFPCAAVDGAVNTAAGSGQREKGIFTWFASRPVAQARAAVLTSLLPDTAENRILVDAAVRLGDGDAITRLSKAIATCYPLGRPVIVDIFSGRAIIPLEAARAGATAVGFDLSPVATLAGRLLAEYPSRDWSAEPALPFTPAELSAGESDDEDAQLALETADLPRLVADLSVLLAEVGRRMVDAVKAFYPRNQGGAFPWGYVWAVTIPCDGCGRRFPLIGALALRHPYLRTADLGQSFRIVTEANAWLVEVIDGIPDQMPTFRASAGKKGKSAHCVFCRHVHSLETVKAKGVGQEYQDALLVVADTFGDTRKIFRAPRQNEIDAAAAVAECAIPPLGLLTAVPDEMIPPGNEDTIRASGYGYRSFASLMGRRQSFQFAETVRAIRTCHREMVAAGVSSDYATALASYAAAALIRRMRRATRGARLECRGSPTGDGQNRVYVGDVFSDESKISFNFDFVETGPGDGAGSWASVGESELKALMGIMATAPEQPVRLRQGSAMSLPLRDGTVDAVVTDPPYYNMIDYSDASDLFHVWLRRVLHDAMPDLFGSDGLQPKGDEIIVKRGNAAGEHRTKDFYERSLGYAFAEARRILRPDGHLVVVFGHSDPEAWKRLLNALHQAGFVVTSSWPSRTEAANTGVASIKVTVTIGCRVAEVSRPTATAVQVDHEVTEAVRVRAKGWEADGLALTDQLMAAYGPAMEVYGRYSSVITPEGEAPLERYLTLARTSVRDAMALKLDEIPLETFDALTRFAVFWLRLYGRINVPKGEARFQAQADELRLEDIREGLLAESSSGYKLMLTPPSHVDAASSVWNVVRSMGAAWADGGSEAVADTMVKAECASDDQQLWAVVGELVTQLPPSDSFAKALTAIQRNRTTIQNLSRGMASARSAQDITLALGLQES